jgi:hypothetical protein
MLSLARLGGTSRGGRYDPEKSGESMSEPPRRRSQVESLVELWRRQNAKSDYVMMKMPACVGACAVLATCLGGRWPHRALPGCVCDDPMG